jgi:hypothetical protein
VPLDVAEATAPSRSAADARSFRSPALHRIHSRKRTKQNSARCTCGRSCVVVVYLKRREGECGSCGTSTPDKSAVRKMALHIAARSVSAPAPHQPPVFQSTYWARLEPEISQSNSRAAIIALRVVHWEALFFKGIAAILPQKSLGSGPGKNFFGQANPGRTPETGWPK